MIFVQLFLTFLQIGAFSFGGGYGMISLIKELMLRHQWLSEEELLDMIAVSESTPGPIAVNMATFIGAKQGGLPGALCATLGVVLPSFVIILVIAALIRNLIKYRGVQAFLTGVRPCVVGLVLATAATLFLSVGFQIKDVHSEPRVDVAALAILAALILIGVVYKVVKKKRVPPIAMIVVSALLGIAVYAFAG